MLMNFPFVDAGMINTPAEIAEIRTPLLSATNAIITNTLTAVNLISVNAQTIDLSALDVDSVKTKTLVVESSGIGPALEVKQLGAQPIASFRDLDNNQLVSIENNGFTSFTNQISARGNVFTGSRILMEGDGAVNSWIAAQGTGTDSQRVAIGFNSIAGSGLINGIFLNTNNANRLTINSAGNIGINNQNPQETLHIEGTIRSTGTSTGKRGGLFILNNDNFDPGQPLTVDGRARVVHGMTFQAGITNFADQSDHSHVIWSSQGRQGWQFIQNGGYSSSNVNTFTVNTIGFNAATAAFNESNLHSVDTTNASLVDNSFPFLLQNVLVNFNTNSPALTPGQNIQATFNPGLVGFVANTYAGTVISGPTSVTVSGGTRFQYNLRLELRDPINFLSSTKGFTLVPLNNANNLNALRIFTSQNEIVGTKVSIEGNYRGIPRYVLVNINNHSAYEGQTTVLRITNGFKIGLFPGDYSSHVKEVLNANQFVLSVGSVMEGFRSTSGAWNANTDWSIIKGSNDPVHLYTPALTHLYFQRFQTSDTSSTTTGGNRAVALGSSAEVDSNFSYALGHNSGVFGEHSTVLGGKNNYILGTYSSIIGGQDITVPNNITNTHIIGLSGLQPTISNTTYLSRINIHAPVGDNFSSAHIRFTNTSNTNNGYIASDLNGFTRVGGSVGAALGYGNNFVEVLRVTDTGRVGINTLTPKEALHVEGEIVQGTNRLLGSNLYFDDIGFTWRYLGNGYGTGIKASELSDGKFHVIMAPNNTSGSDAAASIYTRFTITNDTGFIGNIYTPLTNLHITGEALSGIPFGDFQNNGQFFITGVNTNKRLAMGVVTNTSTMYSVIQSMETSVSPRALLLNPNGGTVGIGTSAFNVDTGAGLKFQVGRGDVGDVEEHTRLTVLGNGSSYRSGVRVWNRSTNNDAKVYLDFGLGTSSAAAAMHARKASDGSTDLILQSSNTASTRYDAVYVDGSDSRVTVIGNLSTTGNLTVNGAISATSIVAVEQPLIIQQALSGFEVVGFLTVNGNVNLSGSNRRLSFGTGITPQYSIDVREETGSIRVGGEYDVPDASGGDVIINKDTKNPLIKLTKRNVASAYITVSSGLVFNTDNINTIDFRTGANTQSTAPHSEGTSRLFINSSGNVGIGTNTPSAKLHVSGTGFNGGGATFEGTDSGNGVNIRGYNGAGINDTTFVTLSDNTSSTFTVISRAGTNAGGEVGRFRIIHAGAERFSITSGGYVGIGTNSPNAPLQVEAPSTGFPLVRIKGDNFPYFELENPVGPAGSYNRFFRIGLTSSGTVNFQNVNDNYTQDINRLVINTATGNIGINPSSQSYLPLGVGTSSILYSNGDITLVGTNRMYTGNLYYDFTWKYADNGFGWGFREDNTGKVQFVNAPNNTLGVGATAVIGIDMFTFDMPNKRIGIGTVSPEDLLDVTSSLSSTGYRQIARFKQSNNISGTEHSRLLFGQQSTNKMFIEAGDQANVKGTLLLQPYGGPIAIGTATATDTLTINQNTTNNSSGIGGITINAAYEPGIILNCTGAGGERWDILNASNTSPLLSGTLSFYNRARQLSTLTLSGLHVGIGSQRPRTRLHIESSGSVYSTPANNTGASIYAFNNNPGSTTAHAILGLRTNGPNSGNPFVSYDVAGVFGWSTGLDNADEDKFKIASQWDNVATNTRLTIDRSGNVGMGTTTPAIPDSDRSLTVQGSGISIIKTVASTSQTGFARFDFATTTPDSYAIVALANNNGVPYYQTSLGPAVSTTYYDSATHVWRGHLGANERMRITANGNIGINTASPNTAAILDVTSTTKGFLPPRMSATERDNISAPPAGLMIYNNTTNFMNYYTGTTWVALATATA